MRKETKQIVITDDGGKVSLSDAEKLLAGHKLSDIVTADVKVTTTITKLDDSTDTSTATDEGTTIKETVIRDAAAIKQEEEEENRLMVIESLQVEKFVWVPQRLRNSAISFLWL